MNVTPIRPRWRPSSFLKRGAAALLFVFLAIAAVMALVIAAMGAGPGLEALRSGLDAARPLTTTLRLAAIYALWHFWPQLVERVSDRRGIDAAGRQAAHAMRHRIAAVLVGIELLIGLTRILGGHS